jgi:hypothetical protein
MTEKEKTQPVPGTDTQRQPNEKPEKQYAQKEGQKFEQYQKEQRDHGRENVDPGHNYEHHGARVSDKGSHR